MTRMVEMTKMSSVDQMTLDGSGGLPEGGLDGSSGVDCACGQDGLGDRDRLNELHDLHGPDHYDISQDLRDLNGLNALDNLDGLDKVDASDGLDTLVGVESGH